MKNYRILTEDLINSKWCDFIASIVNVPIKKKWKKMKCSTVSCQLRERADGAHNSLYCQKYIFLTRDEQKIFFFVSFFWPQWRYIAKVRKGKQKQRKRERHSWLTKTRRNLQLQHVRLTFATSTCIVVLELQIANIYSPRSYWPQLLEVQFDCFPILCFCGRIYIGTFLWIEPIYGKQSDVWEIMKLSLRALCWYVI